MDNLKSIINTIKVLSDENRLRILLMLRERPLCVCEINDVLDIALSTISQHLKLMRNLGIVNDTKDGRWVTYSLPGDNPFLDSFLSLCESELSQSSIIKNDRKKVATLTREACALNLKKSK